MVRKTWQNQSRYIHPRRIGTPGLWTTGKRGTPSFILTPYVTGRYRTLLLLFVEERLSTLNTHSISCKRTPSPWPRGKSRSPWKLHKLDPEIFSYLPCPTVPSVRKYWKSHSFNPVTMKLWVGKRVSRQSSMTDIVFLLCRTPRDQDGNLLYRLPSP